MSLEHLVSTSSSPPAFLTTLSAVGWAWVGLLTLDVATGVVRALASAAGGGPREATHAVGVVLIIALPKLLLLGVLADFAKFFGRVGQGDVYTERNLRTLRSGGEGLVAAAAASAVVVPTLLHWVGGEGGGIEWALNDLTLGVGGMGLAIAGLAHVFREGLQLKRENEQFV